MSYMYADSASPNAYKRYLYPSVQLSVLDDCMNRHPRLSDLVYMETTRAPEVVFFKTQTYRTKRPTL
jgi:hypothetical protein